MGQLGYNQGDLGWNQLNTSDPAAALDFYSKLVGWEMAGEPMPGYHVFKVGDEMLGGVTEPTEPGAGPSWMPYITVTNIDETLANVEGLGGEILAPKSPLPEDGGFMAVIKDPTGSVTGLCQYNKKD